MVPTGLFSLNLRCSVRMLAMDFQVGHQLHAAWNQPRAIAELMNGFAAGEKHQVLLEVTGLGKTFTMARIIEQASRALLPAFAGPALQPDRISR